MKKNLAAHQKLRKFVKFHLRAPFYIEKAKICNVCSQICAINHLQATKTYQMYIGLTVFLNFAITTSESKS